jgi:hypothetical protein
MSCFRDSPAVAGLLGLRSEMRLEQLVAHKQFHCNGIGAVDFHG